MSRPGLPTKPGELPKPRERVEYKRPPRINVVSVGLVVFLGFIGWLISSAWPLLQLRANVKSEISDQLPILWRHNLRTRGKMDAEIAKIRQALIAKLFKMGVRDPKMQVNFVRTKAVVAIEVSYQDFVQLSGLQKRFAFTIAPRVETDASNVEW